MATKTLETNAVIPPGLLIQDEIDARDMSRRDLADAMNLPIDEVRDLIQGDAPLTPAIAAELERTLEMPAHIWIGLEDDYRKGLDRMEREPGTMVRFRFHGSEIVRVANGQGNALN